MLVATSLSGAYAIVLAARDPERFPAIALIAPTGLVRLNKPQELEVKQAGLRWRHRLWAPRCSTVSYPGNIRRWLEKTYADDSIVTDDLVDIYYWTSHQLGARHAPAAFISGHLNIDAARQALRRLTQPALLVWGEEGSITRSKSSADSAR